MIENGISRLFGQIDAALEAEEQRQADVRPVIHDIREEEEANGEEILFAPRVDGEHRARQQHEVRPKKSAGGRKKNHPRDRDELFNGLVYGQDKVVINRNSFSGSRGAAKKRGGARK